MKLEHKIGISITCTFLCMTGAVIGLKMQEKMPSESPPEEVADAMKPPTPILQHGNSGSLDGTGMPPPNPNSGSPVPQPNPPNNTPLPNPTPPIDDMLRGFTGGRSERSTNKNEKSSQGMSATKSVVSGVPTPCAGSSVRAPGAAPQPPGTVNLDELQRQLDGSAKPPTAPQSEQRARLIEVEGNKEFKISSDGARDGKPNATQAAPANGTNPPPPFPPPPPEVKKDRSTAGSPSSAIMPASVIEPATLEPPNSKPRTNTLPTSPTMLTTNRPPNGTSQTPSPSSSSTTSVISPAAGMPAYYPGQSTNAPNVPTPKANDTTSTAPPLGTQPESKKISPVAAPLPPSPVNPPTVPPSAPPTPLPPASTPPPPAMSPTISPTPTPPPPSTKLPDPVVLPVPASTQPPPPATTPPPPQPAANGSTFIPDNSSSPSGVLGVKPAPLPLPKLPSSPLASASDKPVLPRPVITGASVTVYDEQDYTCRAGDSWEELSKRFYMTDRYAKALQRHNQNHARASDRMHEAGQVAPGERVFVPQSYILEERYADIIPKPTTAPANTTMPAVYNPNGSPPPPPPPPPPPANGPLQPMPRP